MGFEKREKCFAALSSLTYKIENRDDFYLWVSKKRENFFAALLPLTC